MQKNISILFLIINNEIFYEIIRMFFSFFVEPSFLVPLIFTVPPECVWDIWDTLDTTFRHFPSFLVTSFISAL